MDAEINWNYYVNLQVHVLEETNNKMACSIDIYLMSFPDKDFEI